ncbi:uncharacterized protein LOC119354610 [Triticum dicoccoides]|uniref:uncharacterized protein LOC119354610 n=1 Tax=Triticum dicoccoides TaxID=85692 RepID=UPI00188F55F2|nr:uncharacterized protein LOC119354610 [Triticum dicoccoides]
MPRSIFSPVFPCPILASSYVPCLDLLRPVFPCPILASSYVPCLDLLRPVFPCPILASSYVPCLDLLRPVFLSYVAVPSDQYLSDKTSATIILYVVEMPTSAGIRTAQLQRRRTRNGRAACVPARSELNPITRRGGAGCRAVEHAGVGEQRPQLRHELAAGAEHLGVDVHVVRRREEQQELRPELGQHRPPPPVVLAHGRPELPAQQRRLLHDGAAPRPLLRAAAGLHALHVLLLVGLDLVQPREDVVLVLAAGEVAPRLPHHRVEDLLRVVARVRQHLRHERHQVRAVVGQLRRHQPVLVGAVVVAALAAAATPVPVAARGGDVPHQDLVGGLGELARPRQPRKQAVPPQCCDAIGEVSPARLERDEHGAPDRRRQLLPLLPLLPLPPRLHQEERQPRQQVERAVREALEQHVLPDLVLPVPRVRWREALLPPEVPAAPLLLPGLAVAHAAVHRLDVPPVVGEGRQRLAHLERRGDHDHHHRDGAVEVLDADPEAAVVGAERAEEGRPHGERQHDDGDADVRPDAHQHDVPGVEEVVEEGQLRLDDPERGVGAGGDVPVVVVVVRLRVLLVDEAVQDEAQCLGRASLRRDVAIEAALEQLEEREGEAEVLGHVLLDVAVPLHVDPSVDLVDGDDGLAGALHQDLLPGQAAELVVELHGVLAVEEVLVPGHGPGVGRPLVGGGGGEGLLDVHVLGDDLDGAVGEAGLDHLDDLGGGLEHVEAPEGPDGGAVAGVGAGGVEDEPEHERRLEDVLQQQLLALVDVAAAVHGRRVRAGLDEQQRRRPQHEGLAVEGPVLDDADGVGDDDVGERVGHPHDAAEEPVAAPAPGGAVEHQRRQHHRAQQHHHLQPQQPALDRAQVLEDADAHGRPADHLRVRRPEPVAKLHRTHSVAGRPAILR